MKKYSWKAAVLTGVLVTAAALSGCGKKEEAPVAAAPNADKGTAAGGEAASPEGYFPLDKEINVIIAGVREDGFVPFQDCEAFQNLEQQTNIKVKWLDWPQSQQKEKRNLAFASGDLPDALYGSWSLDKPDVVKYGSEGMLLRLNDYLNEDYMPNFTRILKERSELVGALSTPEGDIYVLPTLNENDLPLTNDTLLINKEWLDKVGMEMPETPDDLFEVLMAFKAAGDLNGNGKDDEIPLTFKFGENNSNIGMHSLMGFTGIVSNNIHTKMAMKDGVPVFAPATDEYKEYMLFLNKLFSNGLVDREAFTMDPPAYNAKVQTSTPTAGVISSWSAEMVNRPIPGNDPLQEGTYVYMPPLKGKDGQQLWIRRANALNANLSFAISANTKYAEELVRWIDLFYEKETSIENYLGKIGVHIKDEGDGKFSKIPNADGKDFTNDEKSVLVPNKFAAAYILEGDAKFIDKVVSPQNKDAADAFYEPYLQKDYVNTYIMTTQEENEKLAFLTTDLISYVNQSTAKFITEGGIEEGWDNYITQLNKLGLDEYVAIQTQIHNRANSQ